MHRSIFVMFFALACVVAVWSFGSSAQVTDSNPCEQSCYEQKAACVSACGSHTNPIECEQACHEQLDDCVHTCR
jgi:hypothetical protein